MKVVTSGHASTAAVMIEYGSDGRKRSFGGDRVDDEKPGLKITGRFLRLAAATLFLLALVLCGVGVVSLTYETSPPHEEGSLLFDRAVKSFGDAPSNARVAVTFGLTNRSARPTRVIGAAPFCGRHGCLVVDNLPLDIPPLSKRDLVVVVETKEPGQFASEVTLFLRGAYEPEAVLGINGHVVADDEEL